jgi:prolyl 4-hydroxylase
MTSNLHQPKNQRNYTQLGFQKGIVPDEAWKLIKDFYDSNKQNEVVENWVEGSSYVNHWESPSYLIYDNQNHSIADRNASYRDAVFATLQPSVENWIGAAVRPTSMHGMRVYKDGAILTTHVDK